MFINSINTLLPLPQLTTRQWTLYLSCMHHSRTAIHQVHFLVVNLLTYNYDILQKAQYLWSTGCSFTLAGYSFLCSMVYPQFALVCFVQYPTQTIYKDENVVRTCHMTWSLSMYWPCSHLDNCCDHVPSSNSAYITKNKKTNKKRNQASFQGFLGLQFIHTYSCIILI